MPLFFAMNRDIPEYKVDDFSGIMREIFEVPEGSSILASVPKLNYPEFTPSLLKYGLDKDQVIRYISCVYDKGSPFRNDFLEISQRKVMACLYVGFELDENNKWPKSVEDMMMCNNEIIVPMIVRYARTFKSAEFSFLVAIIDDYHRKLEDAHSGASYNFEELRKIKKEIEGSVLNLTAEDDTDKLKKEIYSWMQNEQLELRPEHIAQKLKDGVPPVSYQDVQKYKSTDS